MCIYNTKGHAVIFSQITDVLQPLRDHDYLRLQFLGARNTWLSCADGNKVCDLRRCPSENQNYRYPGRCIGEEFQVIGEGSNFVPIKSGQRIRLRYLHEHNTWMGCPEQKRCDKRTYHRSHIHSMCLAIS